MGDMSRTRNVNISCTGLLFLSRSLGQPATHLARASALRLSLAHRPRTMWLAIRGLPRQPAGAPHPGVTEHFCDEDPTTWYSCMILIAVTELEKQVHTDSLCLRARAYNAMFFIIVLLEASPAVSP